MVRQTFTNITPLPSSITRQTVISFLHDHLQMIDLNPLVIERHKIDPPPHALPGEQSCIWYSLTDKISYLPGDVLTGQVSYTCAFHDLPQGLQTHCYAPMGLDIRDRWSVGGNMPGEPREPVELGLGAPQSGLYLREDVDIRCNFLMAGFVKKTLQKSHGSLVDKLAERAEVAAFGKTETGSPASDSRASTPSLWTVQGMPKREDTGDTPPVGPLLPIPQHQKSKPSPGPALHQEHPGQAFGPYGYQSPPNAPGTEQDLATQPLSHHGNKDTREELFYPQTAQTPPQPFGLQPPSPPQTNTQGGLNYSGTVYRGNSKPQDYNEFSGLNPYEEMKTPVEETDAERRNVSSGGGPYEMNTKP